MYGRAMVPVRHLMCAIPLVCTACIRPTLHSVPTASSIPAAAVKTAHSTPPKLDTVYGKALEGDVREALRILRGIPADALDSKEHAERDCLLGRFADKKMPAVNVRDPFVAELIGLYQDYWMRVLLQELSVSDGEAYLFNRLTTVLRNAGQPSSFASLDDLVDALEPLLLARGFHSIRGVTRPYYELMAWGREVSQTYEVALPETTIPVRVVFMHDFVSLGWSAFATCDKAYSGGWAKDDTLYCVADSYDTASETFSVSYLAHESQHFADYKRFPKLEQPELEYRAKLVELSKAQKTAWELVGRFAAWGGESRSAPHGFANAKVIADLSRSIFGSMAPVTDAERWAAVPVADINRAATALLKANTERLLARGARTVEQVL
jgi:hypothetical protein